MASTRPPEFFEHLHGDVGADPHQPVGDRSAERCRLVVRMHGVLLVIGLAEEGVGAISLRTPVSQRWSSSDRSDRDRFATVVGVAIRGRVVVRGDGTEVRSPAWSLALRCGLLERRRREGEFALGVGGAGAQQPSAYSTAAHTRDSVGSSS